MSKDNGRALVLIYDTYSIVVPVSNATVVTIGPQTVKQQVIAMKGLRNMFLANSEEDAEVLDIFRQQ